jgi:hypothetical protein
VAGVSTVSLTDNKSSAKLSLDDGSTVDVKGDLITATVAGSGETINISGTGEHLTLTSATADKVKITDGTNDVITASGPLSVTITADKSKDTLSIAGKSTISLGISDAITLTGKGAAVVTASGSATVIGGAGTLTFTGAKNAKDSVVAGKGAATLTGGKGASEYFAAGASTSVKFIHGAGGKDTFVGGAHSDTMVGVGSGTGSDKFIFESTLKGGHHTITSFTSGKDTIDLVGYSKAAIAAAIKAGAKTFDAKTHSETITLSDHTKITITGLDKALTAKDVI